MTWVRFKEAQPSSRDFHVVRDVEDGRVLTACAGSCAQTDIAEIHDAPPSDRRCIPCREVAGETYDASWERLVEAIREAERSGC